MARFARRAKGFRPSPVRAVFELAKSPEYASLAGGNPETALLQALSEELPDGVRWTRPRGGFFTWLSLPTVRPDVDLLAAAIEHKLVPGDACWAVPPAGRHVRLAYSNGTPGELREGARRLGEMIRSL